MAGPRVVGLIGIAAAIDISVQRWAALPPSTRERVALHGVAASLSSPYVSQMSGGDGVGPRYFEQGADLLLLGALCVCDNAASGTSARQTAGMGGLTLSVVGVGSGVSSTSGRARGGSASGISASSGWLQATAAAPQLRYTYSDDVALRLPFPVRLMHGSDDVVVPLETTRALAAALRRGGTDLGDHGDGQVGHMARGSESGSQRGGVVVVVEEIQGGDHRLSSPQDLKLLQVMSAFDWYAMHTALGYVEN